MPAASTAALSAAAGLLVVLWFSHFVGGWMSVRTSSKLHLTLPSMRGKVIVVTGGNSGIGLRAVEALALAGATVVLACRSPARGEAAAALMVPEARARVTIMVLDLASLASVRSFAAAFQARFERLHVLILNGGLARSFLGSSGFGKTQDGFEEMVGVNFLGHFLLTVLLLPVLLATPRARVIGQTSVAMANSYLCGIDEKSWVEGRPDFQDWKQYGQSKLAIRLFLQELQRRHPSLLCLACHPGVIRETGLMHQGRKTMLETIYDSVLFNALAMDPKYSHLNTIYLATAPAEELVGGACYAPIGRKLDWTSHPLMRLGALQAPLPVRVPEPSVVWQAAERALGGRGALEPLEAS